MKLGIKVNADAESFDRLAMTSPQLAEVWFNANDPDRYASLFAELQRRNCDVGLHFWGQLDGGILPNIAYPDDEILQNSIELIQRTIDLAHHHGFQYVNIHPGSAAIIRVDYQAQRYDVIKDPVDMDDAIARFISHATDLTEYAKQKKIVFTVETVPPKITTGWYTASTRLSPKPSFELPVRAIIAAAKAGIHVANDFTHTAANIISDDASAVFTYLRGITEMIAPMTRLVHAGYVIPPYNGTDNHDHFSNPLFVTDQAVPNHNQTIELLQLFSSRDDVWILAEPKDDHQGNYFYLKKLLEDSNLLDSGSSPE